MIGTLGYRQMPGTVEKKLKRLDKTTADMLKQDVEMKALAEQVSEPVRAWRRASINDSFDSMIGLQIARRSAFERPTSQPDPMFQAGP